MIDWSSWLGGLLSRPQGQQPQGLLADPNAGAVDPMGSVSVPAQRTDNGYSSIVDKLAQTWPARAAQAAWGAATLPGDVYAGRVDPMSKEGFGRVQDLAGLAMTGGLAGAPVKAGEAVLGSGPIRAAGLRAAAIRHEGKLYTGKTHAEAIANATEATGNYIHRDFVDQGFLNSRGRFVDRGDMSAVIEALGADQVTSPILQRILESEVRSNAPYSSLTADHIRFPD